MVEVVDLVVVIHWNMLTSQSEKITKSNPASAKLAICALATANAIYCIINLENISE